ncbi:MAG: ribosome assembly cofactor RimP [Bacteroidales bacterium]|jgi:ribosome maturation factor RimP|nr:ribosome assembly cofactor RimP [Bacteroidales bacterium]MDD3724098.1 ribosome assembly cofactor RimP [Bacteroidales bacterium]MDD4544438.1 ribosome assembly cofactor RimP [Bacteroidales bacterium]MDY0053241.1 ribosome assembly cofactor RimP [Bacteroidales bacterium]
MIDKDKIIELANPAIDNTDMFIVDVRISKDNRISLVIDSDSGVKIQDCINVSRAIEGNLDREKEDFELNVMSFGVGEPLVLKRQYKKNLSREIRVIYNDSQVIEGELAEVNDDYIIVRPKPKKKKDKIEDINIAYQNIKEAKIIVSFK